jgi:hypothetical protein
MRQLILLLAVLLGLVASTAMAQVSYPLKTFLPIVVNNSVEGQGVR